MRQLNAPEGAVIGVAGKARGRGALLCARTNNAAWRGERGAIGCIALCDRRQGQWCELDWMCIERDQGGNKRSAAGSRVWHYNYFRSYSAERGRYTQADPIGLDGGGNRFGYVGGNSLGRTDFLGLYESSPWLRALVPGQAAFDNGMTALENGNYGAAALSFGTMLAEQVVTASTLGLNRATSPVVEVCDVASRGGALANLTGTLSAYASQKAGFGTVGVPIILDENLAAWGMAEALRARGYNVRSVAEIFGQNGIKDPAIRQFAENIGARVLTADRGRQMGEGFGRLAIQVPGRVGTNSEAIVRILTEALK